MTKPAYLDVTLALPRNPANAAMWLIYRLLAHIAYAAVHYTADGLPATATRAQEVAHLAADANFHINKNWAAAGNPPAYGWCLMYAYAVFQSGRIYKCNDERDILWSVSNGNGVTLSTVLILAPGEKPSQAMIDTLGGHLDYLTGERPDLPGVKRATVWGHGEMGGIYGGGPSFGNDTPCPDKALPFVRLYRKEIPHMPGPECLHFPQTGQDVCHAFKDYFEANGGVPRFGYPITGEMQATIGTWSGTVQYFERARFEWHVESTPGQVLLGLVGVEALAAHHGGPALGASH